MCVDVLLFYGASGAKLMLAGAVGIAVFGEIFLKFFGVAVVGIAERFEGIIHAVAQIHVDTRYENGGVVRKKVHSLCYFRFDEKAL